MKEIIKNTKDFQMEYFIIKNEFNVDVLIGKLVDELSASPDFIYNNLLLVINGENLRNFSRDIKSLSFDLVLKYINGTSLSEHDKDMIRESLNSGKTYFFYYCIDSDRKPSKFISMFEMEEWRGGKNSTDLYDTLEYINRWNGYTIIYKNKNNSEHKKIGILQTIMDFVNRKNIISIANKIEEIIYNDQTSYNSTPVNQSLYYLGHSCEDIEAVIMTSKFDDIDEKDNVLRNISAFIYKNHRRKFAGIVNNYEKDKSYDNYKLFAEFVHPIAFRFINGKLWS